MTRRFSAALFLSIGLISATSMSQDEFDRKRYVADPKLPTVYVREEIPERGSKTSPHKGTSLIFFRLYNNLKWPIMLTVSAAGEGEGDVQMDYELLDLENKVTHSFECHLCTISPLGSGKSLLFSLPRSEVLVNKRLRIRYSFLWESIRDVSAEIEPVHYVMFNLSDVSSLSVRR